MLWRYEFFKKIPDYCSPNLHMIQQGFSQLINKSLSHCFLLFDSFLASWDPQFPAVHPRSLLDFMVWDWPGEVSFGEQHGCVPIWGSRTDMGLMEGATCTNSIFEAYTGICMCQAVVAQKSKPWAQPWLRGSLWIRQWRAVRLLLRELCCSGVTNQSLCKLFLRAPFYQTETKNNSVFSSPPVSCK